MAVTQLRVYRGPITETPPAPQAPPAATGTVSVPLRQVLPLLADAVRSERTWLRDFANDQITITSDLYEVLLAYQHFRRPSA